jgi:hypothetical protein
MFEMPKSSLAAADSLNHAADVFIGVAKLIGNGVPLTKAEWREQEQHVILAAAAAITAVAAIRET